MYDVAIIGGGPAGAVTVEAEVDILAEPEQAIEVVRCRCCPECGNGEIDAVAGEHLRDARAAVGDVQVVVEDRARDEHRGHAAGAVEEGDHLGHRRHLDELGRDVADAAAV